MPPSATCGRGNSVEMSPLLVVVMFAFIRRQSRETCPAFLPREEGNQVLFAKDTSGVRAEKIDPRTE